MFLPFLEMETGYGYPKPAPSVTEDFVSPRVKTMAPLSVRCPGTATTAECIFMEHKSLSHYLPLTNLLLMNLGPCTIWLVMSSVTAQNKGLFA